MKTYKKITSLAATAGFLFASSTAMSQTALIDWSLGNDLASFGADANSNFWNSLGATGISSDVTATVLKDSSTNANTAWSVALNNTANTSNNTGAGIGGAGIDGPVGATNPFDLSGTNRPTTDGIYSNYNANGFSTITFTGLAFNTQYDLSLIGGRDANGSNGFIKVITGTADSSAVDIDLIDSDDLLDTYSLLNDGTILDFSVTSNGSGSIAFNFFEGQNDTDGLTNATFNAMSISVVPEPSAFALLAGMFGLTSVMLRRRR